MITVQNISKHYDKVEALRDVSLQINENELFGLIGPDGAGKTTLFRIMASLILADKGSATLDGLDVVNDFKQLRHHIGYMPGRFSLYQDLSVEENLNFFATVFGTTIAENYHLIAEIYQQIEPFKNRRAGRLSGGMKQKLALCCALIHKPKVLILDEPTTGVDAVSRMEFWQMLKRLQAHNITIVVSTPYMDEAALCDRIALIQTGNIMAIDTPIGITNLFTKPLFAVNAQNKFKLLTDLRNYPESASVYPFGDSIHVTFKSPQPDLAPLSRFLSDNGNQNVNIEPIAPGIEDCFMDLMNQ